MAAFTDRQITCVDCQTSFIHSAGEQQKYQTLGFQNEPKRCAPCRAAKKARSGGDRGPRPDAGGPRPQRELHSAVCAGCGNEARVPFKPRGDRPVYCSACFENKGASRSG